jgi:hypothetical protein
MNFFRSVLEEKVAAVFLLENLDPEFGDREFKLFESWLDRISSWGRSRCLGARPDRAHDGVQPCAREECISLGEVSKSVAPAGGMRSFDSRHTLEDVLFRGHEALQFPSR